MPKSGTWLLTGENGAGKSAILTCLYRMLYPDAFRDHFPSSAISPRLDSFQGAQISYQIDGSSVAYRRNTHKWAPTPRKHKGILSNTGYASVIYVGATADRISPKPNDFNPARSRAANQELIDLANEIFCTNRFKDLRIVNVTRGVNEAFMMRIGAQSPYHYFSEKLLSVGELCVLKLLKQVLSAPKRSLILIDELEIALHPRAQAKLFHVIQSLSRERNHTSIFSTHSATLVKIAKQNQIIWLKEANGLHSTILSPQKSVVLGAIAGLEERATDRFFIVEDDASGALIAGVMDVHQQTQPIERRAKYRIIRVGGVESYD